MSPRSRSCAMSKKSAGQIGAAPFARAGVLIEAPESVPVLRADFVAGQAVDRDAVRCRRRALLAEVFALAAREVDEEIVESLISPVLPVKLLVLALQQSEFAAAPPLLFGAKGDVKRGEPIRLRQPDRALDQRQIGPFGRIRRGQEAPPRGGGEGNRALQFGVVFAAGVLERMRPVLVEHILALAVGLAVKRHDAGKPSVAGPRREMTRIPAGGVGDGAAVLQRQQEAMRGERVDGSAAIGGLRAGAMVPVRRIDGGDTVQHIDREERLLAHAA